MWTRIKTHRKALYTSTCFRCEQQWNGLAFLLLLFYLRAQRLWLSLKSKWIAKNWRHALRFNPKRLQWKVKRELFWYIFCVYIFCWNCLGCALALFRKVLVSNWWLLPEFFGFGNYEDPPPPLGNLGHAHLWINSHAISPIIVHTHHSHQKKIFSISRSKISYDSR